MKQSIGYVALVVRDYDEAIEFYVRTLGFELVEDTFIASQNKRWVLIAPPGADDFWRDYESYRSKGVKFVREPKVESYGTVAVFEDLYGNRWDLLQLSP